LEDLGLNLALRSRAGLESEAVDVLVVDSTGELKALQALADVVIIGKSFLTTGGQNPAEAVMAGKPVICGPHMENFKPLMELLRAAKGVIQVPSLGEVDVQVAQLLRDLPAAQATAARGREALLKHEGATQKTVELVLEKIP
jgi:3-deoxy-D-manno-octulosonic-acid transferase